MTACHTTTDQGNLGSKGADPVRSFLSRLKKYARCSGGWLGQCPAHEDKKNSLSIKRGDDGRVLIHCHAGCSVDAICGSLGIDKAALFASDPRKQKVRIVAEYDYTDERGARLYQKVRLEPKDFRQRRTAGDGDWAWFLSAGWGEYKDWGIKAGWYKVKDKAGNYCEDPNVKPHDGAKWFDCARRGPYRLPELKALPGGSRVISNEGEKACEKARAMGLNAIAIGGATSWREEFAEHSTGHEWIIIVDNDKAGQVMAERQARDCYGKAKIVKIINLPGLPPKGDLYDWIQSGHTIEELNAIIEATPEYVPTDEAGPYYQFYEYEEEATDPADRRAAFRLLKQQAVEQEEKTAAERRHSTACDVAAAMVITSEHEFKDKARVGIFAFIALCIFKKVFSEFEFGYDELYPFLKRYDRELLRRTNGKLDEKNAKRINDAVRPYVQAIKSEQDRTGVLLIDVIEGTKHYGPTGEVSYIRSVAKMPIWEHLDNIDAAAKANPSYKYKSKAIRLEEARKVAQILKPYKLPEKTEPPLLERVEQAFKRAGGNLSSAITLLRENDYHDFRIRELMLKNIPREALDILLGGDSPPKSQDVEKSDVSERQTWDDPRFQPENPASEPQGKDSPKEEENIGESNAGIHFFITRDMRQQLCDLGWPNSEIDKLPAVIAAGIIEKGITYDTWLITHRPDDEEIDDPLLRAIIEDEMEVIA